ncbi:MAG: BrnT family toxin [Gammaproteobacteria bacterium]|nr:BrnT family toxin [Gammaproteobacteria bacterium]
MTQFTWDEPKRLINMEKHGIDFKDVVRIFDGETLTYEDTRYDYDEQRFITIGLLGHVVVLVAHVQIGDEIRIIHARKANKSTARRYFRYVGN